MPIDSENPLKGVILDSGCYIPQGKTGVILIHGFTGTPHIFNELAAVLAGQGYTVSAPLLAGHGTTPSNLADSHWDDWCNTVEDAYHILTQDCTDIYVLGASFGGTLAIWLSTVHKEIKGLILVGTPRWTCYHYPIRTALRLAELVGVKYFHKSKYRSYLKTRSQAATLDITTHTYSSIPISSMLEFYTCIEQACIQGLPKVTAPTLIIQSDTDGLIHPASGTYIYQHIGSKKRKIFWVSELHHEIHIGKSKQLVFSQIQGFIGKSSA